MFKNIFSILVISSILFSSLDAVQAGGGKNNGNTITYSDVSGTRYCTAGEALIDNHQNKSGLARVGGGPVVTGYTYSPGPPICDEYGGNCTPGPDVATPVYTHIYPGILKCMLKDMNPPTITVNMNGYVNDKWTNADVKFDVSVVDDIMGLKKTWYSVNGVKTDNAGANFTLNFTKGAGGVGEGVYYITLGAEDNSIASSTDGSPTTVGNIGEVNYIVKIDNSGPTITELFPPSDWKNDKPIIPLLLEDSYRGLAVKIKTFTCPAKPANASWGLPVTSSGEIRGSCDQTAIPTPDCTLSSSFLPNDSQCNWSCDDGYTKGSDNLCHINSENLTCDANILPKNSYWYDKTNTLILESTGTVSHWIGPAGVGTDGKFISNYLVASNTYSPTLGQCAVDCIPGYHDDTSKCVNNVKLRCCTQPPLSTSIIGTRVDCTLPENQTNVQCTMSPLCGWEKEVLGEWNNVSKEWDYTTTNDGKKTGETGYATHCGQTFFDNSNGYTCNPGYYLISYDNGKAKNCEPVPVGEWSGQENLKRACTNKPTNADYTSGGTNNDCAWNCHANYNKSGNNCNGATQVVACSPKPANAIWNNVSSITQTWEGSWTPSDTSIYNTSGSNSSCRFECAANYNWNGSACIADTRVRSCSGKPVGKVWNTVSSITQTWNGSSWEPSSTGTFNTTPSTTECRYK